jgi:hypothetical protein
MIEHGAKQSTRYAVHTLLNEPFYPLISARVVVVTVTRDAADMRFSSNVVALPWIVAS